MNQKSVNVHTDCAAFRIEEQSVELKSFKHHSVSVALSARGTVHSKSAVSGGSQNCFLNQLEEKKEYRSG